jgi:hypothetical protein
LIFVQCATDGLAEGEDGGWIVWRHGVYSYTSVLGAGKTVPRYTADTHEVAEAFAQANEK